MQLTLIFFSLFLLSTNSLAAATFSPNPSAIGDAFEALNYKSWSSAIASAPTSAGAATLAAARADQLKTALGRVVPLPANFTAAIPRATAA